jgi:glycosyltransferase involved in cell wall biosynthesis
MRIGIVPVLSGGGGGIYQYSLTMLRSLHEACKGGCEDEFIVFAHDMSHPAVASLAGPRWVVKPLSTLSLRQMAGAMLQSVPYGERLIQAWMWLRRLFANTAMAPDPDAIRPRPLIMRRLRDLGIELMLYPAPNTLSFETGIPYVMAIHDLQHRLQPEFPEVSANGEWEWREYLFRNGARYATLLLADSEVGKEDILNLYGPYGVTPDRVKVLPFLPACYLAQYVPESEQQRVRIAYHLPEQYLFYPANFWPHKNHARIVRALGLIKREHGSKIPIVFCGSHKGEILERTFHEVMSLASQLGLREDIRYLGYVPDKDMASLYAGARALVMPTFFGPTNIPVLEAWAFSCPVITSDIRGIREQAGDAAILVNPRSIEAIADAIYRLWTNDNLCRILADKGRQRLASYTPDDFRQRLFEIIQEAKARVHAASRGTVCR